MTDRLTDTMTRLNADFAALFGPVTPPQHLPPQEALNEQTIRGQIPRD